MGMGTRPRNLLRGVWVGVAMAMRRWHWPSSLHFLQVALKKAFGWQSTTVMTAISLVPSQATYNILGAMMGQEAVAFPIWIEQEEPLKAIERMATDMVSWPWWDNQSEDLWGRYV